MNSDNIALAERIRLCVNKVGNGNEFCRITGINRRTLDYYLSATSEPKASALSQIAKTAGSMAAVLCGEVDGIILTGGIAHDKYLVEQLTRRLQFIAPITVMAGEFEMEALAAGARRVLLGEEPALEYTGKPVWNGFDAEK